MEELIIGVRCKGNYSGNERLKGIARGAGFKNHHHTSSRKKDKPSLTEKLELFLVLINKIVLFRMLMDF
jgi:hypothetical protein